MAEIEFFFDPEYPDPTHFFVARVANVDSKELLLKILGSQLQFPDYYGNNWDSLEECLQDLSWIKQPEVRLVHDDLPLLPEQDFRIYLQVLSAALDGWETEGDHRFHVMFPKQAEGWVRSLLA